MRKRAWIFVPLAAACLFAQDEIAALEKLLPAALDPGAVMMGLASANLRKGDKPAALGWLEKAVALKQGLGPDAPAFEALRDQPGYQKLLARIAAENPAIGAARPYTSAPEPTFITEGLASNPDTHELFIGVLNKHAIYRISREGRWSVFTEEGLGNPLGLTVAGGALWACSNSDKESAVLRYDLASGRLVTKWRLPGEPNGHLLNDLAVTPRGEAYATDTYSGAVYYAAPGATELVKLEAGRDFEGANGIVWAGGRLYVSCFPEGVVIVDPVRKTTKPLARKSGITLATIDGLYLHRSALVGVQNWFVIGRVARWKLDTAGETALTQEVLERDAGRLSDPTTGAWIGDTFYFIANSEIKHWKDGKVTDPAAVQATRILALDVASRDR